MEPRVLKNNRYDWSRINITHRRSAKSGRKYGTNAVPMISNYWNLHVRLKGECGTIPNKMIIQAYRFNFPEKLIERWSSISLANPVAVYWLYTSRKKVYELACEMTRAIDPVDSLRQHYYSEYFIGLNNTTVARGKSVITRYILTNNIMIHFNIQRQ